MNAKPYVVFITETPNRRDIYQKLPKENTGLVSLVLIPAKSSVLVSRECDAFILPCFIIDIEIYILTFDFCTPLICSLWCSKC